MEKILITVLTPAIRHGMTAAAGALVTKGIITAAQSGNFTEIGTGMVIGGIGFGWSVIKSWKAASAPKPVVPAAPVKK